MSTLIATARRLAVIETTERSETAEPNVWRVAAVKKNAQSRPLLWRGFCRREPTT